MDWRNGFQTMATICHPWWRSAPSAPLRNWCCEIQQGQFSWRLCWMLRAGPKQHTGKKNSVDPQLVPHFFVLTCWIPTRCIGSGGPYLCFWTCNSFGIPYGWCCQANGMRLMKRVEWDVGCEDGCMLNHALAASVTKKNVLPFFIS